MGANIALEMAASGAFCGPLVLLAPSFSRRMRQRSSAFSTGSPGCWGTCHSPRC
jgi:hypothetical protein